MVAMAGYLYFDGRARRASPRPDEVCITAPPSLMTREFREGG
jgi:hypothetical protein